MLSLRAMLRKVPRVPCQPIWTKLFQAAGSGFRLAGGTRGKEVRKRTYHSSQNSHRVKYWEIIADNLNKAGWSLGLRVSNAFRCPR